MEVGLDDRASIPGLSSDGTTGVEEERQVVRRLGQPHVAGHRPGHVQGDLLSDHLRSLGTHFFMAVAVVVVVVVVCDVKVDRP